MASSRLRRCRSALAASALAASGLLGCAPRTPPAATASPPASPSSPQLASFDLAWERIRDTFPYADMRGLDWDGIRDELRPAAARARTAAELRPIIGAMIARLGESHFQVIPGSDDGAPAPRPREEAVPRAGATGRDGASEPSSVPGDLGLDVRPLGDDIVVVRVEPGSPAALAGIGPGWSVLSIDGLDLRERLAAIRRDIESRRDADVHGWLEATRALQGEAGTTATLTVLHGGNGKATLQIVRRPAPGEAMQLGNLPPLLSRFEHEVLPGPVGYIRFNIFMIPIARPFTDAVKEFLAGDIRGVVIDVRGNPGGIGGMVMGLAGHFIGTSGTSLGTMTTRQGRLDFVANPRGRSQVFEGPVAILVDGMSVSTAELFAAGLQHGGRARLFGERTAGMALPSIIETLPNGDRLQFAVADLHGPSGKRIEGDGVTPDVVAAATREALLAGKDPALDAALAWLRSEADARAR